MSIEIASYDSAWVGMARQEAARWREALGAALVAIHHVGSTSVPGLAAKPIIDLIPEVAPRTDIDSLRPGIEGMGYEWLGEFGLPRRRYCRLIDPDTGKRLIHAHCWKRGDAEVRRHLAFRDALRADPQLAGDYAARKRECAARHPQDRIAYGRCKSNWIDTIESRALEALS